MRAMWAAPSSIPSARSWRGGPRQGEGRLWRADGGLPGGEGDGGGENRIDCHYRQQGRLLLATSSAMYDAMAREFSLREQHLNEPFETVSRGAQREEIATDHYFRRRAHSGPCGAAPRPLSQGPYRCGPCGGVTILRLHARAGFRKGDEGFTVFLKGARVQARDLVFATNGYGGREFPWLQQRIMPFHAYQAVSAPMSKNRVRALMPETAPSSTGTSTSTGCASPGRRYANRVRRADGRDRCRPPHHGGEACTTPAAGVSGSGRSAVRPCVDGKCGGTFDITPRIGCHEGVHYGSGYCFAGVPMGTLVRQKDRAAHSWREGRGERVRHGAANQVLVSRQRLVRALCAQVDEPERPLGYRAPASSSMRTMAVEAALACVGEG